jgi:hypothetical protein
VRKSTSKDSPSGLAIGLEIDNFAIVLALVWSTLCLADSTEAFERLVILALLTWNLLVSVNFLSQLEIVQSTAYSPLIIWNLLGPL